ncbi:MAG TPA: RNA polymerase sigma-70 factor [Burkholderiaceae bacterium]|nr:RNA polymerase sigma-70 factor [Burkholderiaceae bacterium]
MNTSTDPIADPFDALRPRLFSLAYRMLGVRADAEDVVQDAWLRWHRTDRGALQSDEAWLVTVVTRLALDRLRAAKTEREAYVGFWLPEPVVEPLHEDTPEAAAERASDLSMAMMWVLERLAPEERAAFLMRQVFDRDYGEIAALLGKSEAACRQLVHRACERVQQERPRFQVPPSLHRQVLERFVAAAQSGDVQALQSLLREDVQLVSDGGGKVPSFKHILTRPETIARLFANSRKMGDSVVYRLALVNGEPGVLRYVDGRLESAQAYVTDGQRIAAICVVRNPDKLGAIPAL